jgi:putative phage-type endonuclease
MSAVALAKTSGLSREDWLEVRRAGIGGSDAAAIAGVSSWSSALSVYLDKVQPAEDEEAPSEAITWGVVLEDVVAREFARRTGFRVRRRNAVLSHPEHPWMIANVDRLVTDGERGPAILEVKTRSTYARSSWEAGVPLDVQYQVQHYLAVTGYSRAYVAVLIGGSDYRHERLERDEDFIEELIRLERAFWFGNVLAGIPPEPDGSEASSVSLARLYPTARLDSEVILPDKAEELVRDLADARARAKEKDAEAARLENQLKSLMGEAETAYLPGVERPVCTWKTQSRTTIDTKALRAEEPELASRYQKTTETRTFRFSLKED